MKDWKTFAARPRPRLDCARPRLPTCSFADYYWSAITKEWTNQSELATSKHRKADNNYYSDRQEFIEL